MTSFSTSHPSRFLNPTHPNIILPLPRISHLPPSACSYETDEIVSRQQRFSQNLRNVNKEETPEVLIMGSVWVKYRIEIIQTTNLQIHCFQKLIPYKIMRNYSADSYHRLRSLYQQKFLKEGWQPFHQPLASPDRFKQHSSTISHSDNPKSSAHSISSINYFNKHQRTSRMMNFIRDKEKFANQQISIVCLNSEENSKIFWLKEAKKKSIETNRTIYTSDIRDRRWISDSFCHKNKKDKEKALQFKHIKEEKGLSKKAIIIKMLEELRNQNGRKAKKQKDQHVSLEGKHTTIHFKEKQDISLLKKHNVKDVGKKSINCRKKMIEKIEPFQGEAKIEGWDVVQGQY